MSFTEDSASHLLTVLRKLMRLWWLMSTLRSASVCEFCWLWESLVSRCVISPLLISMILRILAIELTFSLRLTSIVTLSLSSSLFLASAIDSSTKTSSSPSSAEPEMSEKGGNVLLHSYANAILL
jgi:hypothetical protein